METLKTFGLLFFGGGLLLITGYGIYHFATAPDVPLLVRASVSAMLIGTFILIIVLSKERLEDIKKEKKKR